MYRTSNPTLREGAFDAHEYLTGMPSQAAMTLRGTLDKCLVLFAIMLASAGAGAVITNKAPTLGAPILIGSFAIGLILALIISFSPRNAPVLSPIYAAVEGLLVGVVSLYFASLYKGIVFNAAVITLGITGLMFLAYRARIIRATPIFVRVVVFATVGIMLLYLVNIVGRAFGYTEMPFLHEGTPMGILFSVFVSGIAALNLILDFDFIEKGAEAGAPKFLEWYGAFALLVTVVWLYFEILRLLAKLRR